MKERGKKGMITRRRVGRKKEECEKSKAKIKTKIKRGRRRTTATTGEIMKKRKDG